MAIGGRGKNDIEINISVDAKNASATVKDFDSQVDKLGQTAERAQGGIGSMEGKIIALNQAVDLAGRAFRGVETIFRTTLEALDRAREVEGLAAGFENLQRSIGSIPTDSIQRLRAETRGLVSDFDLMKAANQAVLLGVDTGTGKFQEMAGAAIKLGQAMGIDAKASIESLTVGIGRQSKMILDNLGVIIDVEAAYKKFAEANQIVGRELNDNERKLAFQAAAFEAVATKARELTGEQGTAAESAQRLEVAFDNLSSRALVAFSQNQNLATALDNVASAIDSIDARQLADDLGEVAAATAKLVGLVADLASGYNALRATAKGAISGLFEEFSLTGAVQGAAGGILSEGNRIVVEKLKKGLQDLANEGFAAVTKQIKVAKPEIKDAEKAITTLGSTTDDTAERFQKLQDQIRDFTTAPATNKFYEQIYELTTQARSGKAGAAELLRETLDQLAESVRDNVTEMELLSQAMSRADRNSAALNKNLAENKSSWQDLSNEMSQGSGGSLADYGNGILGNIQQVNPWGIAIHWVGEIVKAAEEGMFEGQREEVFDKVTEWNTQAITDFLNSYVSGLGNIMHPLVKVVDQAGSQILTHIFGGIHPDTAARESVDRYIADLLEPARLSLVINGQLQEVTDLTFGDQSIYEAIPAAGFSEIGTALAEVFAESGINAQQLASILSENLGGSLNNLQLMFQATGISAEELQQALEQAWLAGDLSAKEFLASSAQVEDLYTQGIPGAIGDTGAAMQNFIEGGLQNGRIAWDALGDMAAEAAEAGATSMDDLKQSLLDAGYSTEQVDQLFTAFAQSGIESLEQLQEIGTGQAAQIVSTLEDMGFAFKEPTEKAQKLLETLEGVDGEWQANVSVNTRVDKNFEELVALRHGSEANQKSAVDSGVGMYLRSGAALSGANAAVSAAVSGGGGYSSGGGGGVVADWKQSAIDAARRQALSIFERGAAEAGGVSLDYYRQAFKLAKELELAQGIYNKRLDEGKRITERLLDRILNAKQALEAFQSGGGGAMTPEQASAAIIEDFLSGKIDAQAAMGLLGETGAAGGTGLPGVGDVAGAYDLLRQGGYNYTAFRGLQNLALEAKEAGLSMGGLQGYLVDQGYDRGYVNDLFEQFGSRGINTIDQLISADSAALIGVISALEQLPATKTVEIEFVYTANGELISIEDLVAQVGGDGVGGGRRKKNAKRRKRRQQRRAAQQANV